MKEMFKCMDMSRQCKCLAVTEGSKIYAIFVDDKTSVQYLPSGDIIDVDVEYTGMRELLRELGIGIPICILFTDRLEANS